jgi:hypothetical protein
MDWKPIIEALRVKQKKAAPRLESVLHVVVRYNKVHKEWDVNRYDAEGIELAHERYSLQGAARYIAKTWMDMYNVTQVTVYQMNGKVKEIIQQKDKANG